MLEITIAYLSPNAFCFLLMANSNLKAQRGIVLVFIILSLILLVFTAIIFVSLTKVETTSVVNFINKRKSLFLSESGFYYAVTKLLYDMKSSNILSNDWQFMGEDINKNGQLDANEDANKNGILDFSNVPLDKDASVSYQLREGGKGKVINPYFSYALIGGEDYGIFKLKIMDESSKININYGNLVNQNDSATNNLKRILNILGSEVGVQSLGEKIVSKRPDKGYTQLEELINNVLTYDEFNLIKEYITTFSYGTFLVKSGQFSRGSEALKEGIPIYAISELFPKKVEKEMRYFININTAPYPVLVAVLSDLAGYYLDGTNLDGFSVLALASNREGVKNDTYTSVPIGIVRNSKPITVEQARSIAGEIIQRRIKQPFTNFYGEDGWDGFLEELFKKKIIDFYQKEVLRANFNPNVNSFLWNPDLPFRFLIDKFLLTTTSFEWTFLPMGTFTIESIGEIFTKDKVLSKTNTQKFVKLWDVSFLSTQEDFVGSNFEYINKSFNKANDKYPTRLGYELDIYPFMYPLEKKANNWTGYIGLSTISLPRASLNLTYKKDSANVELKPLDILTFNMGYEVDEPKSEKLLKSYEELPFVFTDGAFSDTKRTIRIGAIKPPKFDTTKYDPTKEPDVKPGESYPVRVAVAFFNGDLTIPSDKLLGFLEELKINNEDIFTNMSRSTIAGVSITDLKNKKLILFLPHSCCFWDVYWTGGGIHFFVPKHAEELIEKYFPPDVLGAIKELCANSEVISVVGGMLGRRGLECPLGGGPNYYSFGIYFWHKGNWINKDAIYPLVSYGRLFPEKSYGKNRTGVDAEKGATDEEKLDKIIKLYNKKNRYHSAMIQDFYFAISFIDKGKLFKKDRVTMYLDFATPNKNIITDDKRPDYYNYNYLSSFTVSNNDFTLQEGMWNHLGLFFSVKFIKEQDAQDENKSMTKLESFESNIFKNNDKTPLKTSFFYGDLQNLKETDNAKGMKFVPENISRFLNPGIRFGEYVKRGYAKTDRPVFDPYLSGFVTSQSTYDEIYVYKFDEEAVKEDKHKQINDILFKAGRYYPLGGTFTLGDNFWKKLNQEENFILSQLYYYIPQNLARTCSIDESLSLKNKKLPLNKRGSSIFVPTEHVIYISDVNGLNIHINCRTAPPLLETPFVDSIMVFTYAGVKEVISAKEVRDVYY